MRGEEFELKRKKAELLEAQIQQVECLPHLYGWKWYKWAKEFNESTARYNILCAANQISKSSTQIRKCIDWATNVEKWPSLWKTRPLNFWYLYPSSPVFEVEFFRKWVPEFMPRGAMIDHPRFGWKADIGKSSGLDSINFKTNVSIFMRSYAQSISDLQTGTVHAIFCDEELPEELYDELNNRLNATDGYFHMVCTPTLGQEFWRDLIEGGEKSDQFPDLRTWQVSMYDCLEYEDGSSGAYTREKIERIKRSCRSEAEVQRRVYGRFIKDSGLVYSSFDRNKNVKPYHPVPSNWLVFAGIDVGSGLSNHPSAIIFVAVSPDMQKARVIRGWRGDGVRTTAGDVYLKYEELKSGLNVTACYYDWHCKDLDTIAGRFGAGFQKADKGHDLGEGILNTLFKNEMLIIYDLPELKPLVRELESLSSTRHKTKAKDDFCDALRYATSRIAFDWSVLKSEPAVAEEKASLKGMDRWRRADLAQGIEEQASFFIEDEIEAWNEQYEI